MEKIKRTKRLTVSEDDCLYLQSYADKYGISLSAALSIAIERLKRLESKQ